MKVLLYTQLYTGLFDYNINTIFLKVLQNCLRCVYVIWFS